MLESVNLNNTSYRELLEDAVSQIPLYGSEWTNFNVSDPGMTILENLTSFNYLQQTAINTVSDEVRRKLLKLLGFEPAKARPARVAVRLGTDAPARLYPCQKFLAGELVFEPAGEARPQTWDIETALLRSGGAYRDVTYLLDRDVEKSVAVFGLPAEAGAELVCLLSEKPDFTREATLYAELESAFHRNPPGPDSPRFAKLSWQVYTPDGWRELPVQDGTRAFLMSGEITLGPAALTPAVFSEGGFSGYAIRCALLSEDYDVAPRLKSLSANLAHLVQKDTKARLLRLRGGKTVRLHETHVYPYAYVFGRDSGGAPYRLYEEYAPGRADTGRYYQKTQVDGKTAELTFDRNRFGFRPGGGEEDLLIVCCTEEMARALSMGTVYGYVDQELEIDGIAGILEEDFCLSVELRGPDGEKEYLFVRPGETAAYGFRYELLAAEGKIRITDPGLGRDCRASVAACAVTAGAGGNVRAGSRLRLLTDERWGENLTLVSVADGSGGVTAESISALAARFAADMHHPEAAVLPRDYERLALTTPGLCLHKARAYYDQAANVVNLVAKPHGDGPLPQLSRAYIACLKRRLSEYRTLTTRFQVLSPQYLAVDVTGTVYVKSHFPNAREDIAQALRAYLDFASSDAPFGSPVLFNEAFKAVSDLPCVLSIYSLALTPRRRQDVVLRGLDIYPEPWILFYPGSVNLEVNTRGDD